MILYHLLNRGVDKRAVFLNKKDYYRFIHNLFEFNNQYDIGNNNFYFSQTMDIGCPQFESKNNRRKTPRKLLIKLHAFCLMPNHYHLLVTPLVDDGIPRFMKKLNMGYAKYLNEKYRRSGALWQGKYKSVPIKGDPHFSWIPYYIHFNPLDLAMPEWREGGVKNPRKAIDYLNTYRWSSHLDYAGEKNFPSLTQRGDLLEFFGGEKRYRESLSDMLKDFSAEDGGGGYGAALE